MSEEPESHKLKPPYDYSSRKGVLPISWEDFHGICKALAKAIQSYDPEVILPVGRGGYYPGTLLAHMLQVEVYPIRLSRRIKDVKTYKHPRWLAEPPGLVRGMKTLIVDEICGDGETIRMVEMKLRALGAKEIRSAVLYAHTWGVDTPDYIGLVSDALILNPWDREILTEGEFEFHPEYREALALQGTTPDPGMRIQANEIKLAKE